MNPDVGLCTEGLRGRRRMYFRVYIQRSLCAAGPSSALSSFCV